MVDTTLPPIRACIFDMDGLLINTSDLHTICHNHVLDMYGCIPLTWDVKCQMQGRPAKAATAILLSQPQYQNIPKDEYMQNLSDIQVQQFRLAKALPGVEELLSNLSSTAKGAAKHKVHLALATSSFDKNFQVKTAHLKDLFSVFKTDHMIFGDDPRIFPGRGKPKPDIFLITLQAINESLGEGERRIKPAECLVLEDGIPGVAAARAARMRVVWVPHPGLAWEMRGKEDAVLAGWGDAAENQDQAVIRKTVRDGTAQQLVSLEGFPYEEYGIKIGSKVEDR